MPLKKTTNTPPHIAADYDLNPYIGKILLREEIHLDEATFERHMLAGDFTPTPSITKENYRLLCNRCHNGKKSLFGEMNCNRCGKAHVYCRKCIKMGRVLACEPLYFWSGQQANWPSHEKSCVWEGELTKTQQHAADRIVRSINDNESELLVWGVCGSGKTEMIFQGIAEALKRGKRICVATPRADVVRELLPRFKAFFPKVGIQALYADSPDKTGEAQFIIATTHQLLRFKQTFDIIVIDENDAFPYHADPSLPFATKRSKKQNSTTIYLTATPRKQQSIQIKNGKLPHVFVPKRFHGHPLPIPTLKMNLSLQKKLQKSLPPQSFISWFKNRENATRQLLIFVPTIKLAEQLGKTCRNFFIAENMIQQGKQLQTVHAEDAEREKKINMFREKKISILITTTILERGVTFPSIDVVVLDAGHIVFDEAALVQIAGRAGRSLEDPTGEVIFYHDGKTDAMVDAVYSIIAMNKRGGFR